jgi:hypothetical protein
MSLRDTEKIDVVGKGPGGGYDLFIYDAGDVTDEAERYSLLTQKLQSYLEYVANGQYREQVPEASADAFTVRVICHSPPNDEMRQITRLRLTGETVTQLPVAFVLESEFRAHVLQRRDNQPARQRQRPWWRFW